VVEQPACTGLQPGFPGPPVEPVSGWPPGSSWRVGGVRMGTARGPPGDSQPQQSNNTTRDCQGNQDRYPPGRDTRRRRGVSRRTHLASWRPDLQAGGQSEGDDRGHRNSVLRDGQQQAAGLQPAPTSLTSRPMTAVMRLGETEAWRDLRTVPIEAQGPYGLHSSFGIPRNAHHALAHLRSGRVPGRLRGETAAWPEFHCHVASGDEAGALGILAGRAQAEPLAETPLWVRVGLMKDRLQLG